MSYLRLWLLVVIAIVGFEGAAFAADAYLVFFDPGEKEEFAPAAERLAEARGGERIRFDPTNLDPVLEECRRRHPRYVVFVVPPAKIDVDLSHKILELAVRVDDDPFVDFEYGFVTGRDGAAALRFVERMEAARRRTFGDKAAFFASWEGAMAPAAGPLTAFAAMGLDAEFHHVLTRDDETKRRAAAREALASLAEKDVLLFFSHGYPYEMSACFRASDLRDWKVDLAPAVLINCSCYNGAPGRWFAPGPGGPVDRGVVPSEDSVALEILDSGISAYVAGIDPWHGPLAAQVFCRIADDGMRLGEAAKRMFDRLAIEYLPERVSFVDTAAHTQRFGGEGTTNRRYNGAGMILYGDPSFAPFAKRAARNGIVEVSTDEKRETIRIRLGVRPLLKGIPGQDFLLPQNRLLDYYSVRTAAVFQELALEFHEVVPLPEGWSEAPALRVVSARCGTADVATKEPQGIVETTPRGNRLHVRVPLDALAFSPMAWTQRISMQGMTIELEGRKR